MKKREGNSGINREKVLFWVPRLLGILFCIILEVFTLLSHGLSIVTLIENVFVMVLLVALLLAWKWPLQGGILYVVLGALYFGQTSGRENIMSALALTMPLIITGVLFVLDWEWRDRNK